MVRAAAYFLVVLTPDTPVVLKCPARSIHALPLLASELDLIVSRIGLLEDLYIECLLGYELLESCILVLKYF